LAQRAWRGERDASARHRASSTFAISTTSEGGYPSDGVGSFQAQGRSENTKFSSENFSKFEIANARRRER
jgi:hypothetical protein